MVWLIGVATATVFDLCSSTKRLLSSLRPEGFYILTLPAIHPSISAITNQHIALQDLLSLKHNARS